MDKLSDCRPLLSWQRRAVHFQTNVWFAIVAWLPPAGQEASGNVLALPGYQVRIQDGIQPRRPGDYHGNGSLPGEHRRHADRANEQQHTALETLAVIELPKATDQR